MSESHIERVMRSAKLMRWITAVYITVLFVAAVIPLSAGTKPLYHNYTFHIRWDYILHMIVYLPMPLLMGFSQKKRELLWVRVIVISLLITVMFEAVQLVVPYRAFNINDMLANALGVLIGLLPAVLVWRRFSGSGRSAGSTRG